MFKMAILLAKSPVSSKLRIAVRGGDVVVKLVGIAKVKGAFAILKLGSMRRGIDDGMGSNGRT